MAAPSDMETKLTLVRGEAVSSHTAALVASLRSLADQLESLGRGFPAAELDSLRRQIENLEQELETELEGLDRALINLWKYAGR